VTELDHVALVVVDVQCIAVLRAMDQSAQTVAGPWRRRYHAR
jgi:hypothetical protein